MGEIKINKNLNLIIFILMLLLSLIVSRIIMGDNSLWLYQFFLIVSLYILQSEVIVKKIDFFYGTLTLGILIWIIYMHLHFHPKWFDILSKELKIANIYNMVLTFFIAFILINRLTDSSKEYLKFNLKKSLKKIKLIFWLLFLQLICIELAEMCGLTGW